MHTQFKSEKLVPFGSCGGHLAERLRGSQQSHLTVCMFLLMKIGFCKFPFPAAGGLHV